MLVYLSSAAFFAFSMPQVPDQLFLFPLLLWLTYFIFFAIQPVSSVSFFDQLFSFVSGALTEFLHLLCVMR